MAGEKRKADSPTPADRAIKQVKLAMGEGFGTIAGESDDAQQGAGTGVCDACKREDVVLSDVKLCGDCEHHLDAWAAEHYSEEIANPSLPSAGDALAGSAPPAGYGLAPPQQPQPPSVGYGQPYTSSAPGSGQSVLYSNTTPPSTTPAGPSDQPPSESRKAETPRLSDAYRSKQQKECAACPRMFAPTKNSTATTCGNCCLSAARQGRNLWAAQGIPTPNHITELIREYAVSRMAGEQGQ